MIGKILIRGMLAGLVAGIVVFGFAKTFGEPYVNRAIALEEEHGHDHDHAAMPGMAAEAAQPAQATATAAAEPEEELFSRGTQAGIGLFTGVAAYAAGMGGLFALVFAFAYGRVGRMTPRLLAASLAVGGFVAINLVPMLKYPSNPPAVGNPDTIGSRTALYFAMLLISVVALSLAIKLSRQLAAKLGQWNASLVAALGFILVVGIAQALLPEVNEVPEGFPADLLWGFRMVSLGMHALLWAVMGLLFGELTERSMKTHAVAGKLTLS